MKNKQTRQNKERKITKKQEQKKDFFQLQFSNNKKVNMQKRKESEILICCYFVRIISRKSENNIRFF